LKKERNYGNESHSYFLAACEFLKENRDVWQHPSDGSEPWAVPDTFIWNYVYISLLVLCASCLYTAFMTGWDILNFFQNRAIVLARAAFMITSKITPFTGDDDEHKKHAADIPQMIPDKDAPQITLAQSVQLVSELDDAAVVQLSSYHNRKVSWDVEVVIEDGSAVLGTDFRSPLVSHDADGDGKITEEEFIAGVADADGDGIISKEEYIAGKAYGGAPEGQRTVRVTLPAGESQILVKIPLIYHSQFMPTLDFYVRLRPVADMPSFIGPISKTNIRILNADIFPCNYELPDSPTTWQRLYFLISFLKEIHRTYTLHTNKSISSIAMKHQVMFFILASYDGFISLYLYQHFINDGLTQSRLDWSIFVAVSAIGAEVYRYHVTLHYFDGGLEVDAHLQYLIVRKYLQFTDVDHARLPHCLEDFRCAETRCEKIGTHLWTRANTALVQFYNFLFSFAFLIWSMEQTGGMGDVISIMMGLMPAIIITAGIFISARIDKSWNLVEQEEEGMAPLVKQKEFIYHSHALIRAADQKEAAGMAAYNLIWKSWYTGMFERFYHEYYTSWSLKFAQAIGIAMLWACGPYYTRETKPLGFALELGSYLALMSAIGAVGHSVHDICMSVTKVFETTSSVQQIAKLLNFKTDNVKVEEAKANASSFSSMNLKTDCKMEVKSGSVLLQDLTFNYATSGVSDGALHPSFEHLNVQDKRTNQGAVCTTLPAGCIIGLVRLPKNSEKLHLRKINLLFMKIVGMQIAPQSGSCVLLPESFQSVIGGELALLRGSLWENLVYGVLEDEFNKATPAFREAVWNLCRRAGFSPTILGSNPNGNWGDTDVNVGPNKLGKKQLVKVGLVRALLHQPEMLLLHGVGNSWDEAEQQQLVSLIHAYANGEIAEQLEAVTAMDNSRIDLSQTLVTKSVGNKRTVLWSAPEELLVKACSNVDRDVFVTLESPSCATLRSPQPTPHDETEGQNEEGDSETVGQIEDEEKLFADTERMHAFLYDS